MGTLGRPSSLEHHEPWGPIPCEVFLPVIRSGFGPVFPSGTLFLPGCPSYSDNFLRLQSYHELEGTYERESYTTTGPQTLDSP